MQRKNTMVWERGRGCFCRSQRSCMTAGSLSASQQGTESSYQIIMATEIIGISHLEREIVANVVRYNIQEFAYDESDPGI